MKAVDQIRELHRHMDWADAAIWRAVLASSSAAADETIRTKLHHAHMVQRAFLGVWLGREHQRGAGKELTLKELAPWGREFHVESSAFLATLTDDALDEPRPVPWAAYYAAQLGHEPVVTTLGETLLQAAVHTAYHRGQIAMRLRELGSEPPLTDLIVWIWHGKPHPEWPAGIGGVIEPGP